MTGDPFAALAELAAEEHRLVLDGRFEDLEELDRRRATVLADLPQRTPPAAIPHLEEAARTQALVTVALRAAHAAARAELLALEGRREGLRAYAAATR